MQNLIKFSRGGGRKRMERNGRHVGCILLTITTAAQNEVALSYHKVRGLYCLAVVFCEKYNTAVKAFVHYT